MPRLDRQIETRLGTEEAFAFIADFGNAMRWDPGVVSSKAIDAGPVGLGSRSRLEVRLGRLVAPMEYRVTAFEPPRRVVLTGAGSGVTAVDDIRFAPSGVGTHVDYTADIRLGGLLRLAEPFLGGAFRKLADDALEGMRKTLDQRADDSGPAPGPADGSASGPDAIASEERAGA
jgi:carbon monoxide dehydrogenase subunit G